MIPGVILKMECRKISKADSSYFPKLWFMEQTFIPSFPFEYETKIRAMHGRTFDDLLGR